MLGNLTTAMSNLPGDAAHAGAMAQAVMAQVVQRQALTLAFDEVFLRMALLFLCAIPLAALCKRPAVSGAPVSEH